MVDCVYLIWYSLWEGACMNWVIYTELVVVCRGRMEMDVGV